MKKVLVRISDDVFYLIDSRGLKLILEALFS